MARYTKDTKGPGLTIERGGGGTVPPTSVAPRPTPVRAPQRDGVRGKFLDTVDRDVVPFLQGVVRGAVTGVGICPDCGSESAIEIPMDAPTVPDRLRASDILSRHSLGTQIEVERVTRDDVADRLRETFAVLKRELDPATCGRVAPLVAAIWREGDSPDDRKTRHSAA